jgi:NarL family two-component system response regulator LiaR
MKVIQEFNRPSDAIHTIDTITRRELEVLRLIARGLSNQEISHALNIHERTIAKYVSNILSKLHVANRTQAALYAIREGLMSSITTCS